MIATVRRLALAALVLALPAIATAQSYTISPSGYQLVTNDAGRTVSGGCVWTYTAGTTTAATTYSDTAGTPNTNPIKADAGGRFVAYLATGSSYKYVYENTPCTVSPPLHGATLKTIDNIQAMPASAAAVDDTGTAGESITAGQCVYLSNGDGSKTPGQWYKCDSANGYSAFAKSIGIATVNIASAGTGTIRVNGLVTGLTSLSTGADYYVGATGALTATAPANIRRVGQAESATTLLLTGNPPPTMVGGQTPFFGFFDDFRLSLTTATCGTTADVTAATTLFWTPCTGNRITLFDTSGNVETCTSAEISIAVPATTSQLYDVWVYDSTFGTCTVTLELLAWTNDTTRATATARTNGRWAKSGNASRMYVGSMRTTTVSGQTEDSLANRLVWNYYNRLPRELKKADASASWAYATGTIRQANGSTANQVTVVVGQPEVAIAAWYSVVVQNDNATVQAEQIGIGLDSTTTYATNNQGNIVAPGPTANMQVTGTVHAEMYPAVGYHTVTMLEKGTGTGTTTWYGTGTYPGAATLLGRIDG